MMQMLQSMTAAAGMHVLQLDVLSPVYHQVTAALPAI
jgi:hypothetical protein